MILVTNWDGISEAGSGCRFLKSPLSVPEPRYCGTPLAALHSGPSAQRQVRGPGCRRSSVPCSLGPPESHSNLYETVSAPLLLLRQGGGQEVAQMIECF